MPIPKPAAGESESDFTKRFMADPAMLADFPDEKQRVAICLKIFSGKTLADKHARRERTEKIAVHLVPLADKHARRERTVTDAKLSAKALDAQAEDSGWLEGYAFVWGNVDLLGEIMQRGSCARSIQQAVPAGNVKLMTRHYRDGGDALESIGTVTQAKEDDYGLWIHAEFDPEPTAQEIRSKILRGEVKYLSGGFIPIQREGRMLTDTERSLVLPYRKNQPAIIHTEVKLLEVTATVKPVNEVSIITNAKNLSATDTGRNADGTASPAPAITPSAPPVSPGLKRDLAMRRARLFALGYLQQNN